MPAAPCRQRRNRASYGFSEGNMKNVEKTVGAVVVGFSLISGCSSSSTSTPAPSQDGGTGQAGTPLTVWVFGDARPRAVPLADATIAWDGPGGAERVEVTTDAEGKAVV